MRTTVTQPEPGCCQDALEVTDDCVPVGVAARGAACHSEAVLTWFGIIGIACAPSPSSAERNGALDQLYRASILIRSAPPSPAEIDAVRRDPTALAGVVHEWPTDSPEVGALVRDLHALDLFVRNDLRMSPPARGPLNGVPVADIVRSLDDAPLALIEHIVTHQRPYTEIVTADYVLADPIVGIAWGPRVDRHDPSWQVSAWHDGRPAAGILSSTTLWMRHPSGNLNHHRSRAAVVADALLCDDVSTREGAGSFDPELQEQAVRDDPSCQSCHAVLDPLSSAFWGFRPYILPIQLEQGYNRGCSPTDPTIACYPVPLWDAAGQDDRVRAGMPAPALYGQPIGDLRSLGAAIVDDPRFATCTVRRFWSFLARVPRESVPDRVVESLAATLERSGYDAGALLLDIVSHPAFGAEARAAIRPGHLARTVHGLTGYRWQAEVPDHGIIDLATTDRHGLNLLMGGMDGWRITGNEPGALPIRELSMDWLAQEAAYHAVQEELSSERRDLFVHGATTDDALARAQLAWWRLRILGMPDADVTGDLALLTGLLEEGSPERAWALVLTAMLQHPRLVVP